MLIASVRKETTTKCAPDAVWDAIRDIGALHTRLVPGFVVDTRLDGNDARIVKFGNGMIVREPIVTVDDDTRRLVWTAEVDGFKHYNGAVQVFPEGPGSRVVWVADFLPHDAIGTVGPMMEEGMQAMKRALDSHKD